MKQTIPQYHPLYGFITTQKTIYHFLFHHILSLFFSNMGVSDIHKVWEDFQLRNTTRRYIYYFSKYIYIFQYFRILVRLIQINMYISRYKL
ncbi:hypothetical protein JOE44_002517 [Chryseobacterium sp. PvR013]|nr:hypothetical protein [Chryseobacterium sp. PvR013]